MNYKSIIDQLQWWIGLSHPNILPLLGYCLDFGPYPVIVTELMKYDNVLEYVKRTPNCNLVDMVWPKIHFSHNVLILESSALG